MQANTTGSQNVAIGASALNIATTSQDNIAIGYAAMGQAQSGSSNNAIGSLALYSNISGGGNNALGSYALNANTIGNDNTAVGSFAMYLNSTGNQNVALGSSAMYQVRSATTSVAIGYQSGYGASGAAYTSNTMVGYKTGVALSTGSNNLLLGYQAGNELVTGSNNIIIGYDIDATSTDSVGGLNIGNLIYGTGNGTGSTVGTGNIGIGTTSPGQKLSVAGDILGNNFIGSYFTGTSAATSSLVGGLSANILNISSTTASSTFANGLNLTGGCFAINGSCVGGSGGVSLSAANTWTALQTFSANASTTQIGSTGSAYFATSGGNVGIATTSPGWKFSVASSSSYIVGAPTGGGVSEINVGTGNYTANGENHAVRIYAYKVINSRRVYSQTYATASVTVNSDLHTYDLRWTWSAPASGADGYRILKSATVNGYTYNYYTDDAASPFDETAGAGSWALGNTVLPSALFDDLAMIGKGNLLVEGAVAIGTTTPWAKLSVNGSVALQNLSLSTGTPVAVCIDPTTFEITVNTGAQTCSVSSKRFKHNIETLESGLALVNKLRPVSFDLNSNNQPRIGFIAEEVAKVESRLVFTEANGKSPRGVRYEDMTALLAKAIQEQQVQIDLLLKLASTTASSTTSVSTGSVSAVVDQVLVALRSASEWVVTKITATLGSFDRVETNTASVKNGIEFKDTATGDTYCVTITNGEWDKQKGTCGAPTGNASADTVAPVISINGNNPAQVQKNASYLDLGAMVTDNLDNNLGITVAGDQIDTTLPGTYTVTYSAVDRAGNRTEAIRTVEVIDPAAEPAPAPTSTPAAAEPAVEPVAEPVPEPTPAAVPEPAPAPTSEPVLEPAPAPAPEQAPAPVDEPVVVEASAPTTDPQ